MSSSSIVQQNSPLNVNSLVESWASAAAAPNSSLTIPPRYPSQSARDEIHYLLAPIVNFSDKEENKIIFEKIINIINEKMAFLSQLNSKVEEAYDDKKDFYRDFTSGTIYPSFGLSYDDVFQQIDYMINDNLNLMKEITSFLVDHQPLES